MGSLSSSDREKIKLSLPKQFNKLIDVCIAKLYIAYPSPTEWTYTGLYGALCLTDDLVGNTFFLKLVDVSGLNKGVIWDQELYVNFDYIQDRTFFHTFEMEDCLAGLLFEDVHEAQHFYKRVTKRQKYGSKNTVNNKNAIKLEKEIEVENKAAVIHGPRGEELISNQRSRYDYSSRIVESVGYGNTDSYEANNTEDIAPANDDFYDSFVSDQSAIHKQPPPPPPPSAQILLAESPTEQPAYADSSRFASSEEESSKHQTPVHRLPPPPEHYASGPPPTLPSQVGKAVPPPLINAQPLGQVPLQTGGYGNSPPTTQYNQLSRPTSYGQPSQSTSYGQPPQSTSYGQPPQSTSYGQPSPSASYGQPPQSTSFGNLPPQNGHSQLPLPPSRQQPLVPQRTNAPPPPPSRRSGPPAPPRKLANQATGHRPLQSLPTQKTGGRSLPPPPPLRRSATGAAPPPPPARRVATGATTTAGFTVSNIPATTFGAPSVSHTSQPPLANSNVSPANGYQQPPQHHNMSHQQEPGYYRSQNSVPQAQSQQEYSRPQQTVPQQTYVSSPPSQMHLIVSQAPPLPQHQQQTNSSGIPPPPPMMQQSSIPPPPPMMQQSSIPPPPPMMQQSSIPPPPPMMQQSSIPTPPPMMQQSSVPQSQAPGGDSRDALLSSIRSSGIGSLRKTDTSEINDRSAVQVASSTGSSMAPSASQPMGAQTTGGGALADALAAALNSRKKKVSSFADDDDGEW